MTSVRAFVGLGSNESDPAAQLTAAFAALDRDGVRVAGAGRLLWSPYVGGDGARVLNTVAELRTCLAPRALLGRLLAIEARAGRVRDGRAGRILDLDLLSYGDVVLDEPGLTLPHPRLRERGFVLEPWVEVAPLYVVPGTGATVLEHAATWRRDAAAGGVGELEPSAHPPFADRRAAGVVLPDHAALTAWRDVQVGSVGVVMTMGALHAGHAALVQRAAAECDAVVGTIFVNPTQFAPGEDLERYPRTFDADVALLRRHGAAAVYAPTIEDLYPDGPAATLDPGGAAAGFEGAQRPTHFAGVATVVTKLWRRTRADRSYFGRKDAQQLAVLEQVRRHLGLDVEVIACPTVRAIDSMALSSRNRYLDDAERTVARELAATLDGMAQHVARGGAAAHDLASLCAAARGRLERAGFEVDYLAVVDPATMAVQTALHGPALALAAVRLAGVRLLDNRWLAAPLTRVVS